MSRWSCINANYQTPVSRFRAWLGKVMWWSRISEQSALLLLGIGVGVVSGLGAVAFRWLISQFHVLFFEGGRITFSLMGPHHYTALLPMVGGVIVGLLTYFGAREAKGHGVPEIMEAVAEHGGRIRPRVAIVKSLASSICIGSGGSVGREGPIAQIGAALGSTMGQVLKLSESRVRTLVACGAGGGIAATFNAPLAGAFFALEIILADWKAESFAPVVSAAVAAAAIGRWAFGDMPAFTIPEYEVSTFAQLPMFLVLGLLAAFVGVAFTRLLYLFEDGFETLPIPPWLLPAFGGALVGVVGLYDINLYGVGYGAIGDALCGINYTGVGILLTMLVLKLLATCLTLGSGGSGGIFAPSLFMGSMLGAMLGHSVAAISSNVSPGAYALAGMGAVFAAASHAPVTATLIVFELTGDYRMILPLMLSCGVSVVIARAVYRFSIYNLKLVRRGVHVGLGQDTRLLNEIKVAEAMATNIVSVSPEAKVRDVAELFDCTKHHGFPLVDEENRLHGIVTLGDVRRAGPQALDRPVKEIATHELVIAFPDESLNDALRKLGLRNVGRLPVVDPNDHCKLLGLITRKNIITAYNRALIRAHTNLERTQDKEYYE